MHTRKQDAQISELFPDWLEHQNTESDRLRFSNFVFPNSLPWYVIMKMCTALKSFQITEFTK